MIKKLTQIKQNQSDTDKSEAAKSLDKILAAHNNRLSLDNPLKMDNQATQDYFNNYVLVVYELFKTDGGVEPSLKDMELTNTPEPSPSPKIRSRTLE